MKMFFKLVVGLGFLAAMVVVGIYFYKAQEKSTQTAIAKADKEFDDQWNEHKARYLINSASTQRELTEAEEVVVRLPKVRKEHLSTYVNLKRSLFYFNEAEDYLRKAVEIEVAAGDGQNLHPLAKSALEKAIVLYEKSRKEAEKLKETGDPNIDFSINYLKGEIYYRFLELAVDKEMAAEIFNQTVTYYKQALRNKPNDINTVVNIELLIKNQSRLLGGAATDPQQKKKQMLTSKKFGVNKSSGN
jgi:hypothetical protein